MAQIMHIDPSTLRLTDRIINNPKFRQRALSLLDAQAHPQGDESLDKDTYASWFQSNIPPEIYFGTSLADKLDLYGLAYFSPVEDPAKYKGTEYYDVVLADYMDRESHVLLATDKYSPYWYAMSHSCYMVAVLAHMMISELIPERQWYVLRGQAHALVCDHTADEIRAGQGPAAIFDLLIDDKSIMYENMGPLESWETYHGDMDALWAELEVDVMRICWHGKRPK